MAEAPRARSALASLDLPSRIGPAGEEAVVTAAQRRFLGKLNLRGDPADDGFVSAVRNVLGGELPTAPQSRTTEDSAILLPLGPDEWLVVVGSLAEAGDLFRKLDSGLDGQHAAVSDISSGLDVIRVGGRSGKLVLQKGCALDLDPPAFGVGHCARCRIGNSDVVLHQIADGDGRTGAVYDLYVRRSYAKAFWQWLEEAAMEYGLAVSAA